MIIAVNTRLRKEEQPEGYEDFLFGILNLLTKRFPQHRFVFIADKPYTGKNHFPENVSSVVAGPETRGRLRLQYWFNYKLPAILRKHKADVFVSMEGIACMRTKIPQCVLVPDPGFLQDPRLIKKSQARFFKKNTAAFLAKAKSVATVSEFSRTLIANRYKMNVADIAVINPVINEDFIPIDWQEKEAVKERYSEGKAYFLFSGDVNPNSNLINLLKAFSFFKKRQKSNMMLLIAGKADASFKKELNTYKFRNEVLLLENLEAAELATITAAAYALVYPVIHAGLAPGPLQAMQCAVPLVVSNRGAQPSIFGDAALYCDPASSRDIAENMMLVFKDEDRAGQLIKAGNALLPQYHGDKTADLLMRSIEQAINN